MMGWFTSQLRRPVLPEFTPQALAVTAYGFAKLEVRHGAQGYRQVIQGLSGGGGLKKPWLLSTKTRD